MLLQQLVSDLIARNENYIEDGMVRIGNIFPLYRDL